MNKADAKLIELAKTYALPPAYNVRIGTACHLMQELANAPLDLFSIAYAMGFIKGQRAATNKNKSRPATKQTCGANDRAFERGNSDVQQG